VLVIEDDQEMAEAIAGGLRTARMAVDLAFDGSDGLARSLVNDYDVIVLDRDLPGLHGDEVCARLVAEGARSRVLMLTAAASSDDLVDGLGLGADAFLAAGESSPQPAEADPWQAVSEAASAVAAAVRAQDRDALDRAISALADAAREIPS